MKAKLVPITHLDGTLAYINLMPVTDADFEHLEPSGMALELDTKTLQLSHGDSESILRYQHLQQYEQMLDAANKRINELEAVCREVVNVFGIRAGQDSNGGNKFIGMSGDFTMDGIGRFWISYDEKIDYEYPIYEALRHLLDTLPPSE